MRSLHSSLRLHPNLVHITSALSLQRFSNGLVGVFIPLVILQSGGALWMIAGFYLVHSLVILLADFSAIRFIQQRGAHLAIGIGFVFGALQLGCILGYANAHSMVFLVAGAISFALAESFGDNARHVYVSSVMELTTKSSSMASMEIVGQAADFLGPLAGLLVGSVLGANWLLIAGLAAILCAFIPLREMGKLQVIDQTEELHFSMRAAPLRDIISNISFNVDGTTGRFLWQTYLAVALGTFSTVGGVASITAFITIVTVWVAGRRGDRGKNRSVLRQGVIVTSCINFFRIAATRAFPIAAVGSAYGASQNYTLNALNSTYYSHAKRKGLQYIVAMEIACDIAYVAVWGILFLVLVISHSHRAFFVTGFILAAVAIWGTLLITPQTKQASR
ncbi:MAG TPA: hypothetical protein VK712_04550 [Verrucomicrobiae bacterium]|jgi:MFS family permease|nr:hypothetical protein [Verrucomicrobiae bacterium]